MANTVLVLAGLDRRTRRRVAGRHGVVDVDHDAGVGGLVGAGERDAVPRVPGAGAAADADLRARDVELRAAGAAGAVQRDVLGTQQVLAVLQAAGDGDWDGAGAFEVSVGFIGRGGAGPKRRWRETYP